MELTCEGPGARCFWIYHRLRNRCIISDEINLFVVGCVEAGQGHVRSIMVVAVGRRPEVAKASDLMWQTQGCSGLAMVDTPAHRLVV